MEQFDIEVAKQLEIMDKLLYLQAEIERCQSIEKQLIELENGTKLLSVQNEIKEMKEELLSIQLLFKKQTEETLRSYKKSAITSA
ncbi:YgaB family protein [Sutcliffiella cohnii]|uniref:YgaB-like protein n=1 Tax=Sutcliffiella cohnii TaxID=33932 RepID=A0A223KL94_9BACI|nr:MULTISPECIES: YgaB family protein [Sutcliffiella]AST90279.1 hypothetical protein BC6307_02750 [Sutcliffiella cohnii]MED4018965.1 YgaB family protein [Sutcliffiella cohnii]WBL15930.1 hypothetical protein O1A01_04565 [Sutcliffiella sp. NC1]